MKNLKFFLFFCFWLMFFPAYAWALDFGDPVTGRHYVGWYGEDRIKYSHKGIDIVEKEPGKIYREPVSASETGIITRAEEWGGYGLIVEINHGNGFKTRYAHLEKIYPFQKGQLIEKGQIIGIADASGLGDKKAHHLHFEILKDNKKVNPLDYLDPNRTKYKCRSKNCSNHPLSTNYSSPGGDHPDDTFAVEDAVLPTTPVDLENAYYRAAAKKGKTVVIGYYEFKRLIKERDTYLENLADSATPDQTYLDTLDARITQLYNSFGTDFDLFFKEYESAPDVAVLQSGYYKEESTLLKRYLEPAFEAQISFSPSDLRGGQPVLVIPSGGLFGLENSAFFKASLDEYVKNGGTLIVFAQQHGYEFGVLPVPQEADGTFKPVSGRGWTEDISCFADAAYVDTAHQMLAGQSRITPSLNIDGYFTDYPSSSTIILRRTANDQPAMLSYPYGNGLVIVTSMYSDWAYGHGQASSEEIALVRDVIAWAKKPAALPEIRPGETVSLSLSLINNTATDAAQVKFTVLNPNKAVIAEQTASVSVSGGQTAVAPFTYTSSTASPLGIWYVDYTLLDAQGNTIQPRAETDSGRFVINNPQAVYSTNRLLSFSVQTDRETYLFSMTGNYTIKVANNSAIARTITAVYDGKATALTVPAESSNSFIYSKKIYGSSTLYVDFYDESGLGLARRIKTVQVAQHEVEFDVSTDKQNYSKGENVALGLSFTNNTLFDYQAELRIQVRSPLRKLVFEDTKILNVSPKGMGSAESIFNLTSSSDIGTYYVSVEAWYGTFLIGKKTARFELPQSQISVVPNLPASFISGANKVSFTLTNNGLIGVNTGSLEVTLNDPDGTVVYSELRPFTMAVGETKTQDFPINIPVKFGDYSLTYRQSDETKTGLQTAIVIPSKAGIALTSDKPSYRIRETVNVTADLTNSGRFDLGNLTVMASAPDLNFTDSRVISIAANAGTSLNYSVPVPETVPAGLHNIDISLATPAGGLINKTVTIMVPGPKLTATYQGQTNVAIGDNISIAVENTGGVDENVSYDISLIGKGVRIFQNTFSEVLSAGSVKNFSFQVPQQAVTGDHSINIAASGSTGVSASTSRILSVQGLSPVVSLSTGQPSYLSNENVEAVTTISSDAYSIENAALHLEVVKKCGDLRPCQETVHWQNDSSVNLGPNASQTYSNSVGLLPSIGLFHVRGVLTSSTGQVIWKGEYPFSFINAGFALNLKTDKGVYAPGEPLTVTGEIINKSPDSSYITVAFTNDSGNQIYQQNIFVAAYGTQTFSFKPWPSSSEGFVTYTGQVLQNNSVVTEAKLGYEVIKPEVTMAVIMPDMAGNSPFDINIELVNTGRIEAKVTLHSKGGSIGEEFLSMIMHPGEKRAVTYTQQITNGTHYYFSGGAYYSGTSSTFSKDVIYGLGANITVDTSSVYLFHPPGKISIPVTMANTGQLDHNLPVEFKIYKEGMIVAQGTKSYFIQNGTSVSDVLYYDLPVGLYTFVAQTSQPTAIGYKQIKIANENDATLSLCLVGDRLCRLPSRGGEGAIQPGFLNGSAIISNLGWNTIEGELRLIALKQGVEVWNSVTSLNIPPAIYSWGNISYLNFNIDLSGFEQGTYELKASVINNSGQELTFKTAQFTVTGPSLAITSLPVNPTFTAGQQATLNFSIKNNGNQDGELNFSIKAMDVLDAVLTEWIKAGEQKNYEFTFLVPDDIEANDYVAYYQMGTQKGQVNFHVNGLSLSVDSILDKQNYNVGDIAQLTLAVNDLSPGTTGKNLFARVNYPGFEETRSFTLNGSTTINFSVPLTSITGDKLFYGIYHESGRSIHLNSVYIYDAGNALNIQTDRQVYNPGETVLMTVSGALGGTVTLEGPGNYSDTFVFTDSASKSFTLPGTMTAGTYFVSWTLTDASGQNFSGSHPIDVSGIQVMVKEAVLNKAKYSAIDNINLSLTIESNQNLTATLKTWIINPDGTYSNAGEQSINLSSTSSLLLAHSSQLSTTLLGVHRLVYGIYAGELLLSSGSEAFDVGDALLLEISTDKIDYPSGTESVAVSAELYGTVSATIDIYLDGQLIKTSNLSLSGFATYSEQIGSVSPGDHAVKAVLKSGGLVSVKETEFVYGSDLPDLVVYLSTGAEISPDNKKEIMLTAFNNGKTVSTPVSMVLYEGESGKSNPLATLSVNGLAPGESSSFVYQYDLIGKAGDKTLYAQIDSLDEVYEFNEENNENSISINIPMLTFYAETETDVFYSGDKLNINTVITNLSGSMLGGSISTEIMDQTGSLVFSINSLVPPIAPSSQDRVLVQWDIPVNVPEGTYTIKQSLKSIDGSIDFGMRVKTVTLKPGKDFTLAASQSALKVESGQTASFGITISPVRGFDEVVSLTASGYPEGATVFFTNNDSAPPFEASLKIATSSRVPAGTYTVVITATGGGKTHSIELRLDVADFDMTIVPSSLDVKELESAEYPINVSPLNGFESPVHLDVSGLPNGIKASFDNNDLALPVQAKLKLKTSKWARPGTYEFTVTASGTTAYHKKTLTLVINPNLSISPGIVTASGPGPQNKADVKFFTSGGMETGSWRAFDSEYGANIASGDIDGDGFDEIVAGTGPDTNGKAMLQVFERNGSPLSGAQAVPFNMNYGVTIAVGDIDGDWLEEIVVGTGPDPKGEPRVKVYKSDGLKLYDTGIDLYPYKNEGYKYGVNVSLADTDGDNLPEILTAPGPDTNAPATIKAFKVDYSAGPGNWRATGQTLDFTVEFDNKEGYGANIASGDLDGDGLAEIIVGSGPDPTSDAMVIKVYRADGTIKGESFNAYEGYKYGAYVACGDLDLDGKDEIIAGAGPDPKNKSLIRIFRGDGVFLGEFFAYPDSIKYGVKPTVGRVGIR